MKISSFRNSVYILFLFITGIVSAQDLGSETVVVVKPYTPSVNDAFKIKETPKVTDSVNMEKKTVQYSIVSFPMASTFTPDKGSANNVAKSRPPQLYDNYITLDFGTYPSAFA